MCLLLCCLSSWWAFLQHTQILPPLNSLSALIIFAVMLTKSGKPADDGLISCLARDSTVLTMSPQILKWSGACAREFTNELRRSESMIFFLLLDLPMQLASYQLVGERNCTAPSLPISWVGNQRILVCSWAVAQHMQSSFKHHFSTKDRNK